MRKLLYLAHQPRFHLVVDHVDVPYRVEIISVKWNAILWKETKMTMKQAQIVMYVSQNV